MTLLKNMEIQLGFSEFTAGVGISQAWCFFRRFASEEWFHLYSTAKDVRPTSIQWDATTPTSKDHATAAAAATGAKILAAERWAHEWVS